MSAYLIQKQTGKLIRRLRLDQCRDARERMDRELADIAVLCGDRSWLVQKQNKNVRQKFRWETDSSLALIEWVNGETVRSFVPVRILESWLTMARSEKVAVTLLVSMGLIRFQVGDSILRLKMLKSVPGEYAPVRIPLEAINPIRLVAPVDGGEFTVESVPVPEPALVTV